VELLTQHYQDYRGNYTRDNKEVTELWAYNFIDMFIQIKACALKGLSKDLECFLRFFKAAIHLRRIQCLRVTMRKAP
jgi:hypothetical protein